MRRLVAFVVAVAMVAGALYARSRMDDDDRSTATPTELRVVCSTELAAACEAIDAAVTVEDAGLTADRLVDADDPDVDAWVVPSPWPELVDIRRDQHDREPLFGEGTTVASTRLAMVAWDGALPCAADPSWRCVADATGQGVKPGFADPTRDAMGLVVLGHLAVSLLGRTDLSTIDLEDPAFDDTFVRLVRAVPDFGGDPLTRMLVQGRSAFDVVALADADAQAILTDAARKDEVRVLYPAPMGRAGAVVAARRGIRLDETTRAEATDAVVARGWDRGGQAEGLPSAGFLDALVERWEQVAR